MNSTVLKLPLVLCLLGLGLGLLTGCRTPVVTKSEFEQVSVGMSYEDVVDVVGNEAAKLSSQAMGSLVSLGGVTTVCVWRNTDGSGMSAIFENNRLVSKSEHKLH